MPPTVHERRQACGFRDNYEKFVAAGYTILGCSGDGAELQSSWKEKQSYQFDFVCDEGLAFSTSVGMKMDGREMSARSAQTSAPAKHETIRLLLPSSCDAARRWLRLRCDCCVQGQRRRGAGRRGQTGGDVLAGRVHSGGAGARLGLTRRGVGTAHAIA